MTFHGPYKFSERWSGGKIKSRTIHVAFNQLWHCPRKIRSSATDIEPVQVHSERQSKKLVNTASLLSNVFTNDDSVVQKCSADTLVEEEPTYYWFTCGGFYNRYSSSGLCYYWCSKGAVY